MSIWARIAAALAALTKGEGLAAVFDRLRAPPERSVAFTIAVIALGAKIAKADGQVTRAEVATFRRVFVIPPEEEANAARVYDLARQDIAGFEDYARKIKRLFGADLEGLEDLMEGLFMVALADGHYHDGEDAFLGRVAAIFGLSGRDFGRLRARFVPEAEQDPWDVLGVDPDMPLERIRAAWRAEVMACHPDRMMAHGVPEEALKLAEHRLIAVNRAWERISGGRE